MNRALVLVGLMLLSILSGMATFDEETNIVELEKQETSARTATNPLGWEWVAKDHDAGYVWTRSVETDSNQNTYIAGIFRGGSLSLDQEHALNSGGLDAFVAKFSSNGDVLWLTTFGGELNEHVEDMLVDGAGNVVVVGSYDSPQFNLSTDILTNSGSRDGFAVQIDAQNGAIDWGNSLSGTGFDNITGVTKDTSGYYAYSGWTSSPTVTVNGTQLNNSGDTDFLVLWSYANGTWHQGRIYGGSGQEQAHDIVADQNGKVMVAAEFSSSSLTLDQTSINHGGGTGSDSLVIRVAHAGVEWVRKPICNQNDRAWNLDVDSAGNVFVVGEIMSNHTSSHSITWGSIQINNGRDRTSVYVVKFSNVGAIGWALETQSGYSNYFSNPSIDVWSSKILVSFTGTSRVYFSGSSSSNTMYASQSSYDNSFAVELTNTGSCNCGSYQRLSARYSTIDDVAWLYTGSSSPDVVAPINQLARKGQHDYSNRGTDAPSTSLMRYTWSSGPSSEQYTRMVGHTASEEIIDIEPLNSTTTIMLGMTSGQSHNLRFGDSILGGNTSWYDDDTARLFLAVADDNGTWAEVDQIKLGKAIHVSTDSRFELGHNPAAMAVAANGTVWVGFYWSDWVEIPGLISRNSGSGFMVASWSPANGWMSADSISFWTNHYVNIDIAVDGNGDVFLSGTCYGQVSMNGVSYSGSNSYAICFAQRDATTGWTAIHREYTSTPRMDTMTGHPNGGVVFWAKEGSYAYQTSSGTSTLYPDSDVGGPVRLFSSNGSMWAISSFPTSSSSYTMWANSMEVSSSGDTYIAGHFMNSISFPNCCSVNSGGNRDGFVTKINSSGSWDWSIALGGTQNDYIYDVAIVDSGSIAVVGEKYGVISVGLTTLSSAGTGFVAMASTQGTWEWAAQPTGQTAIQQVTGTGNGTVGAAGQLLYSNTARTFGLDSLNSSDGEDIFLARMSADADADGITDNRDNCQQIYNPSQANFDGDLQGDICDSDDDAEGIPDSADSCPMGALSWTSNSTTDYDTDGCKDDIEDEDDDNDGALDIDDMCATGALNWSSDETTDYDTDGCKDSGEDLDDDDDTVNDTADSCPKGELGWISTPEIDHDNDGCLDAIEDADDDDDGVDDADDSCPRGDLNWTSSSNTDNDGDGCLDATEDLNDDNDDFPDYDDSCPRGATDWYSGRMTDYDGDGCLDSSEDLDDDADGVNDLDDNCPRGIEGWITNPTVDFDADGCHDWNEDTDDDGDGVSDLIDLCSRTTSGATANAEGCAPGQVPDVSGGGSSSVNYTDEQTYVNNTYVNNTYVNNTYENNTYSNETFQNQSFENNTYTNETFQNQTYLNNTNLNQTINEHSGTNETLSLDDAQEPEDSSAERTLTWEPITAIAIMIILVLINFMHLVKKPAIPTAPPAEMLMTSDEMESAFDQTEDVLESEPSISEPTEDANQPQFEIKTVDVAEEFPPAQVENTVSKEGFEWVEWPVGSGQNFYRPENTDGAWQKWPIEE